MAARKTKKKKFSEFKAWLEGVESMQETNWVPDERQWNIIRKEINNVVPDEVEVEVEVTHTPQPYMPHPQMPQPEIAPTQMPQPTGGSALEDAVNLTVPTKAPLPSGMKVGQPDSNIAVKTANIDTSDGKYESSFL